VIVPPGLLVDHVELADRMAFIAQPMAASARCRSCDQPSSRVHSRYTRTLADLPVAGMRAIIEVGIRRFHYTASSWSTRIFAERLGPDLAPPCQAYCPAREHRASPRPRVYVRPTPAQVAQLVDSRGADAASARWHWMGDRTLNALARQGRAALGLAPKVKYARRRSYTDEQAAIDVEAAFVLGSLGRAERAAGMRHNTAKSAFETRGLAWRTISPEDRGVATAIGRGASDGDATAIAALEARRAFEDAVASVRRRALALVAEQPETGRYQLPQQDAALAEVLRDEDPAAISAVFPDLRLLSSEPPGPEPDVIQTPSAEIVPAVEAASPTSRGRLPDVETLRALHAEGLSCGTVAGRYGVTATAVHSRWSRLGLDTRGRCGGMPKAPAPQVDAGGGAAAPAPPPSETAATAGPSPRRWQPGTDYADVVVVPGRPGERLAVEDLAVAVDLMRLRPLSPEAAVALVRADVAATQDATTETTRNGVPESAIFAWLDAWANERPLPELSPGGHPRG
jgi:hypothetical protein